MSGVLAVDGGQSALRIRHSHVDDVIEVEGVSRLEGDPVASVASLIGEAIARGHLPPADLAVLGLTTSPSSEADQRRLCELVAHAAGLAEIWLADDTVTSHIGALSGGVGVSLVVGTGVACLARGASKPPRVFDGLGYLLGDDGSAWSVGRAGLRAVLRAQADRGPATSLTAPAITAFGVLEGLHIRLHESIRPVNAIAQFARDVLAAAAGGDLVSIDIVHSAAADLRDTAVAAVRWTGGTDVPVGLGGRLLGTDSVLRHRLDELLAEERPLLVARSADGDPLDGALALGRNGTGPFGDLIYIWKEGNRP